MRILPRLIMPSAIGRIAPVLAVLFALSACTTIDASRTGQIEFQDGAGFSITEQVKVSGDVRDDFRRALTLIEQEQYESGIELLQSVTQAAPDVATAHLDLGIAFGLMGDLERARSSLETALQLHPRHPVSHNELGIIYRKMGKFDDARESYEKALAIYPDFHYARRNLAILCDVYLAEMSCALEHYELYTQVVPDDEAVAMWLVDLQNRMGE